MAIFRGATRLGTATPRVPVCTAMKARATDARVVRLPVIAIALVALVACRSGDGPRGTRKITPEARAAPATTRTLPAPPAAQPAGDHAAGGVDWHGNITWHTWAEALPLARKESKPILLLVYADWCPHCRALGAVFSDPEIGELAKRFVMVRQNHDDAPPWLEPYTQKYGGYVPRIFFFDSDGKIRDDITSGHPRYPYFYAAEQPEFLKSSMRRITSS